MAESGSTSIRIQRTYRHLAYLMFNCIVLLIVLNVILGGAFFVLDWVDERKWEVDSRVSSYRERFADYDAYTRTSKADVTAYLDAQDEMGGLLGFQYEPWVQFRNPEFTSLLLNTDERGFRKTVEPATRPGQEITVHVFGGSTTFGYGVPDKHTIPSYLQRSLEQRRQDQGFLVKNYGQAFYYSSQEQLVMMSLIKEGNLPNWAVFIDGGNDTSQLSSEHDAPVFTPAMERLWATRSGKSALPQELPAWLPMLRLARSLSRRLIGTQSVAEVIGSDMYQSIQSDSHMSEAQKSEITEYIVSRYRFNMRIRQALCREFEVKCLFVWQPHPAYKYDRNLHKTYVFDGEIPFHWTRVYDRMESTEDDDFLYLGDLTERSTEKVYVDDVHYNESLNERIADKIAGAIGRDLI